LSSASGSPKSDRDHATAGRRVAQPRAVPTATATATRFATRTRGCSSRSCPWIMAKFTWPRARPGLNGPCLGLDSLEGEDEDAGDEPAEATASRRSFGRWTCLRSWLPARTTKLSPARCITRLGSSGGPCSSSSARDGAYVRRVERSIASMVSGDLRQTRSSGGGTRTHNLRINSPPLCRLSYPGTGGGSLPSVPRWTRLASTMKAGG
jgi:hypothetical protein